MLRKWEQCDNERITYLEKICFSDPWNFDMVCETANHTNFYGVVCEEGGKVVGYAGAIFVFDSADIALVAVDPDYRRRGIAFDMLKKLESELFEKGVENLFLEVRVSNLSAQSLYLKFGFNPIGKREKYYENAEDAIVMLKVLKGDKT